MYREPDPVAQRLALGRRGRLARAKLGSRNSDEQADSPRSASGASTRRRACTGLAAPSRRTCGSAVHGHPQFKRTRKLGKEIAKSTAEDVRHPGRNPGFLLLDTLAAASAGAGTAARIGAAGKAVAEGGRVGAVAKALAHAPEPKLRSLRYVPCREGEQVARGLKPIYTAIDAAQAALEAFDEKWGARFPGDHAGVAERLGVHDPVSRVSARAASRGVHDEPDRSLEPTAAEGDQDKRTLSQRGGRPELIYLAITNAVPAWTRTRNWRTALLAFKIHFGDRLPE